MNANSKCQCASSAESGGNAYVSSGPSNINFATNTDTCEVGYSNYLLLTDRVSSGVVSKSDSLKNAIGFEIIMHPKNSMIGSRSNSLSFSICKINLNYPNSLLISTPLKIQVVV